VAGVVEVSVEVGVRERVKVGVMVEVRDGVNEGETVWVKVGGTGDAVGSTSTTWQALVPPRNIPRIRIRTASLGLFI